MCGFAISRIKDMIWLRPQPLPPLSAVISTGDPQHTGRRRKRYNLLTGEVMGGGAKSYDGEKA
jgi:hypothetical protein